MDGVFPVVGDDGGGPAHPRPVGRGGGAGRRRHLRRRPRVVDARARLHVAAASAARVATAAARQVGSHECAPSTTNFKI